MDHEPDAEEADGETENEEGFVSVQETHAQTGEDAEESEGDGLGRNEVGCVDEGPMFK